MTQPDLERKAGRKRGRRAAWAILAAVVVAAAALGARWTHRGGDTAAPAEFAVARGPLAITLTESGSVQSRERVIVRSEVEGRSTVLSLVDEGKYVKEGELLVELDSSALEESRVEQQIRVENAESLMIQSRESLEVTRNQAKANVEDAELALKFAHIDLEKFEKGEYVQQLSQADADITIAREELQRAEDKLDWSKKLANQGYLTRTELQADELASKRAELNLSLANSKMQILTNYTYRQSTEKLNSEIKKSGMALERIKRKSTADVVQAEAEAKARETEYGRQKTKLDRLVEQIAKCRITAPSDGMVVYATTVSERRWGQEPLQTGVEVVQRQELIYLPATEEMMALVQFQETSLPKLKVGQSATIRVDALPGRLFRGHVARIGFLPNSSRNFLNPDLKIYDCHVFIDDGTADLRPGMTCRVEILVESYADSLYVPVQCVLRVENKPTVYLSGPAGPEPRNVEIGLDNNRMVRILSGLKEGEKVLLAPPLPPSTMTEREGAAAGPGGGPGATNGAAMRPPEMDLRGTNGSPGTGRGDHGDRRPGASREGGHRRDGSSNRPPRDAASP